MASALLFALGTEASLVAGLALQVLAMAMLDVVINLYLLDHIPRRGLNHFEPRRLLFAGSAFALGPWVGVYLHRNVAENLPYVVAALSTLALLTYFWTLAPGRQPEPAGRRWRRRRARCASCRGFISQPRLVLSWVLALGRNGWWVMNFIYTPIYVTNAGYRAGDRRGAGLARPGADAAGARVGADRAGDRHPQSAEPGLRSHRHLRAWPPPLRLRPGRRSCAWR